MPQLIFYVERDYPQVRDLMSGKITIGRNKDNSICLNDSRVSVYHSEITREKDGSFHIRDTDSQNGTAVNGRLVEEIVLKDGDQIKFGAVKAVFVDRPERSVPLPQPVAVTKIKKDKPDEKQRDSLQKNIQSKSEELAKLEETIQARTRALDKIQVSNIDDLKMAVTDLKRKSEIERNNLMLLRNELEMAQHKRSGMKEQEEELEALAKKRAMLKDDCKQALVAMEDSRKQKEALDAEMDRLSGEIDIAGADLKEKQKAAEEAVAIVEESKSIKAGIGKLESELKTRKIAFEELSKTIAGEEKTLREKALLQKEEMEGELDRISKEIEKAGTALEEKRKASEEAALTIEKARAIESRIGELENELKSRESAREELGKEIAAKEKASEELGKEIDDRSGALKELEKSVASKQKDADELGRKAAKNDSLIRFSGERLASIEASLKQATGEFSLAQDTQASLNKQSHSLSRLIAEKSDVLQRLKEKINLRIYGREESVSYEPLRVINPEMRSLVHYFHHGAGIPGQDRVDPIGYYGLAACTKGSMHREADSILSADGPILVLLSGDLDNDRELIESISREMAGRILLVCWRDGRLKALAAEQGSGSISGKLTKLLAGVSGIVSVDPETAKLIDKFDVGRPHLNVPLPIPVEIPEWVIPAPTSKRTRGIFVSGDGFDPDSQIHRSRRDLINKLVADTKTKVTLYGQKSITGLKIPGDLLTEVSDPLRYIEYLGLMGEHQLVTGFGKNIDGGDIIGDAVLARTVFIGGDRDNSVDEILFPNTCLTGDDMDGALKSATRFLTDPVAYLETMEQAQSVAAPLISFDTVRDRLNEFFHFISANPAGV